MATPKFNTKSPTIRRILREAQELSSSPSPDYTATPLETDLFEWHFTLRGPPSSSFAGGIYHGRIVLPPMYPLRPPSFRFVTPSGRFETNREICLSISGHHEETWQPAWGVRTALVALRSFMETDPKGQLGGLETTDDVRRRLAAESKSFRCSVCAKTNGEIMEECEKAARECEAANGGGTGGSSKTSTEPEVPSELKLAWRDELEGGAAAPKESGAGTTIAPIPTPTSQTTTPAPAPAPVPVPVPVVPAEQVQIRQRRQPPAATERDSETDELAEGFVHTDPLDSIYRAQEAEHVRRFGARPPPPEGQLGRGVPVPAERFLPLTEDQRIALYRQRRQAAADSRRREQLVNVWIDRLIVLVGFLLVTLILKVLLF